MRGYVLDYPNFVEHDDLWDEGNGLKPQAITPNEFPGSPSTVDDEGDHKCSWKQYFEVWEVITHCVISLINVNYGRYTVQ